MLWNWFTVDACFISSAWHVRSRGAFAGSCIGVIFLVMCLEFLRRAQREFDRYVARRKAATMHHPADSQSSDESDHGKVNASVTVRSAALRGEYGAQLKVWEQAIRSVLYMLQFAVGYFVMLLAMYYNGESFLDSCAIFRPLRTATGLNVQPSSFLTGQTFFPQTLIIVSGYIIIMIFVGAFFGAFVFQWDTFSQLG